MRSRMSRIHNPQSIKKIRSLSTTKQKYTTPKKYKQIMDHHSNQIITYEDIFVVNKLS
jgi:hypothetical protein